MVLLLPRRVSSLYMYMYRLCVSCNPEKNDYQKVLSTDDVIATQKKKTIKIDYHRFIA